MDSTTQPFLPYLKYNTHPESIKLFNYNTHVYTNSWLEKDKKKQRVNKGKLTQCIYNNRSRRVTETVKSIFRHAITHTRHKTQENLKSSEIHRIVILKRIE